MKLDLQEQKLIIERYLFIIKVRFNLKREYLIIGVPTFIAILFLLGALLTGHTFPPFGGAGNTSATGESAAKMDAYKQLVADMQAEQNVNTSTAAAEENVTMAGTLPEEKKSSADMDQMLVIAFIIATSPYSIDVLLKKRLLKKQEVAFSQFLYKLSELMRGGIDPVKGIIALSRGELGAIKKEVQDCASSLVLGHSLEYSMNRLNEDIGSKLVSKYIKIIVQAAHTGGNVSDLIFRTSEDMRAVLSLEKEKESNLKQYSIVFYLAQGILVMLVYILSTSLLPLVQGTGTSFIGGSGLSDINFNQGFFHMIILNALFGGLIIGMITEGDLKQGLKHTNLLLATSYIACAMVVLPTPPLPIYNITVQSGGDQMVSLGSSPESVVFNITDLNGHAARNIPVKLSLSPGGGITPKTTNGKGLVTYKPTLSREAGSYIIKATAGRSFNSTTVKIGDSGAGSSNNFGGAGG
jgi:archaeal flagellar protein FlaJ